MNTESVSPRRRQPIRLNAVKERTGLSRTTIYRLIKRAYFPAPHKLSERITVWDQAEIDEWMSARMSAKAET